MNSSTITTTAFTPTVATPMTIPFIVASHDDLIATTTVIIVKVTLC